MEETAPGATFGTGNNSESFKLELMLVWKEFILECYENDVKTTLYGLILSISNPNLHYGQFALYVKTLKKHEIESKTKCIEMETKIPSLPTFPFVLI